MLVNKTDAAKIAGVSRRTFYNHIKKKGISIVKQDDGQEKIDVSELQRVYGQEKILTRLKEFGDAQVNKSNSVQSSHGYSSNESVKYNLLEERRESDQKIIKQLESENAHLRESNTRMQDQLETSLQQLAPLPKLLEDHRTNKEEVIEANREAAKEKSKRENLEEKLRELEKQHKKLRSRHRHIKAENEELRSQNFWQWLTGIKKQSRGDHNNGERNRGVTKIG